MELHNARNDNVEVGSEAIAGLAIFYSIAGGLSNSNVVALADGAGVSRRAG
jgi:hypothetical protein